MRFPVLIFLAIPAVACLAVACKDQVQPTFVRVPDDDPVADTDPTDTEEDLTDASKKAAPKKDSGAAAATITGKCADTFGDKIMPAYQRFDGRLYAVQMPNDQTCAKPNRDHVIIQVLINGAVYRMVTNVQSDRIPDGGDGRVRFAAVSHALLAPAWAEGWHADTAKLDYPTSLGVHNADFAPYAIDELVAKVASQLHPGDPVSVYATAEGNYHDSAHLVHRNDGGDGAIVANPTSNAPTFLLFHFDEQVF